MDSEDENDEDWIEMCEDEPQQSVLCLFCSETFPSAEATYGHCKATHGFDIRKIQKVHRLDCFGYIKLINYVRKKVCAFSCKKSFTHLCLEFVLEVKSGFMPHTLENNLEQNKTIRNIFAWVT